MLILFCTERLHDVLGTQSTSLNTKLIIAIDYVHNEQRYDRGRTLPPVAEKSNKL